MRILVLSHTSEFIGGAERSMLEVFDYWAKKYSVEPEFIIREPLGSLVTEMKKRDWKYYPVRFTFWSYPKPPATAEEIYTEYKVNNKAVRKIEKIINNRKPDLVITNTIISPWAALAAHALNYPHIWFVREYGDLDHDRKFVLSHDKTYKDVGNLSNLVVANSNTMARHIEKYVDRNKVTTLYNPFDIKILNKKAKAEAVNLYKHADSLKLIMTSNISHTKGQLDAVEAIGLLNTQGYKTELCLVGKNVDRPYYEQIENTIKKYHLEDKVHLVGHQANVLALVNLADIGIVASRKEAFGRTTFECIAIGKPVIGANTGATPEMVAEGSNGYIYEPGNSVQLAEKLKNYHGNRELLKKHGSASRKKAAKMMQSKFNIDALYKKVSSISTEYGSKTNGTINFINYWNKYEAELKKQGMKSIRKSFKHKLRQAAKSNYYRARKIKAKVAGK